ncbi:hypothetical protein CDAR_308981 [Caerostris darwini]|uniref:Uncharacterized protein n=1 Tax=Caerostris darwini TaxID=1538125 RepID=A0AAV4U5M8_9ARAC|nr:hypothetical protein CDAR_308981 [Caerostris darwini]
MGSKLISQSMKKLKRSRTKRASKTCLDVEPKYGEKPIADIETKNIPLDGNVDDCVEAPRQTVLSQRAQRLERAMIANSERKLRQRMKGGELVFRSVSTCRTAKRLGLQAKLAYPKNYFI